MSEKIAILLAITALLIFPQMATAQGKVEDFRAVEGLPKEMVAGTSYRGKYKFRNATDSPIPVRAHFVVTPSEGGEWKVKINGARAEEAKAGVFKSEVYDVGAGEEFTLRIDVISDVRIVPGKYNFEVELYSRGAKVYRPANLPPVANANGPYSVVEGETIELNGTGSSDPDGDTLLFSWKVTDDPTGRSSLSDADTATPTFYAPSVNGDIDVTVRLTVLDGHGHTDSDACTVTVEVKRPPAKFVIGNIVAVIIIVLVALITLTIFLSRSRNVREEVK